MIPDKEVIILPFDFHYSPDAILRFHCGTPKRKKKNPLAQGQIPCKGVREPGLGRGVAGGL
jgi:hypothetical protein